MVEGVFFKLHPSTPKVGDLPHLSILLHLHPYDILAGAMVVARKATTGLVCEIYADAKLEACGIERIVGYCEVFIASEDTAVGMAVHDIEPCPA